MEKAVCMRNVEDFLSSFNSCLQKEPAFCTAACPFHVDIPDMIARIQKKSYAAAFRLYRNAVAFPRIVSALCPAPCRESCPLSEDGEGKNASIDLPLIESLLIALTGGIESNQYNLPQRKQRVAIIGAGISGLGCALRLATKKYHVEIFERSGRIGGRARDAMEPDVFDRDVTEQFRHETYTLHLNHDVQNRETLSRLGFDAVFVATGSGGMDFGLLSADSSESGPYCLEDRRFCDTDTAGTGASEPYKPAHNPSGDHVQAHTDALVTRAGLGAGKAINRIAWFAGGSLIDLPDQVYTLADGLLMANAIDNYLKTGRLIRPRNDFTTGMKLDPYKRIFPAMANDPSGNGVMGSSVSSAISALSESFCGTGGTGDTPDDAASIVKHVAPGQERPFVLEDRLLHESLRCIRCACDACRLHCDLTDYYKKWPLRIRDEVFATTLPGKAEVKATPARRLMSTCNQCGLCKSTCPQDIDLGGLILAGRRSMHRQEKAPWAFHDFWLRDMAFSDGPEAHLCRMPTPGIAPRIVHGATPDHLVSGTGPDTVSNAISGIVPGVASDLVSGTTLDTVSNETPGTSSGAHAFFPGCQLGASDPDIVIDTYRALRDIDPGMGILLRCCGAPAEWAGDDEMHQAALSAIQSDLNTLGNPTLLAACPTCIKKFQTYLPGVAIRSVYEWIAENRQTWAASQVPDASHAPHAPQIPDAPHTSHAPHACKEWAIFDPCAAGNNPGLKDAVRFLGTSIGLSLQPLPVQDQIAKCCGYGGQPAIANPDYAHFVAEKRMRESALPYITYCINCRDVFRHGGKKSLHLLELLFCRKDILQADHSQQAHPADALRKTRLCTPLRQTQPKSAPQQAHPDGLAQQLPPTVTMRRENRKYLKSALLSAWWNEEFCMENPVYDFSLIISDDLCRHMDAQRILEDEIYQVVDHMRRTGKRVFDPETGIRSGYLQIGHMTFWASYRETDQQETLELVSAWSHRMAFEAETVWRGVKQ